jgi:hypothetical protein
MKYTRILFAAVVALGLVACDDDPAGPVDGSFAFSFDSGLEGWTAAGTDLTDPPVQWSIQRTTERTKRGAGSAKFFLDNMNDAGKIWLQRAFTLEANTDYTVRVSYAFGTADYGDINLWRIIAGAHTQPPQTAEDLAFRDGTGNGAGADVGYRWVDRTYTMEARADAAGQVWVVVGVWGTWESPRTYYVDDLKVAFTKR